MRIMLTERIQSVIVREDLEKESMQEILGDHGFIKVHYEEIENPHALPKVNLDRLYSRNGEIYEFYGWEAPSGFMDTATGNVLMDMIGYFIL